MTACVCKHCREIFLMRDSAEHGMVMIPQSCPYCRSHNGFFYAGPVDSWVAAVKRIAKLEQK